MKKVFAVLSLSLFVAGLTGCNTIAGAGRDVERTGEKVQNAASDTQRKM